MLRFRRAIGIEARKAYRRSVRDQNVRVNRNRAGPGMVLDLVLKGVGVVAALGERRGSVNVEFSSALKVQSDGLVFEVVHSLGVDLTVSQSVFLSARPNVEPAVVVAADDDLVPMREGGEPVQLLLDVGGRAAIRHVAGMDEKIAVWHFRNDFLVGVREADDPNGRPVSWRSHRTAAEPQNDTVQAHHDGLQGGLDNLVEKRRIVPLASAAQASIL